ncbi:MAG TPA: glycosyl hydrolase [Verrucomicrobiae bacterium]|nr:glycosyl hydrolase [Verrucomicrobiae bacterium]
MKKPDKIYAACVNVILLLLTLTLFSCLPAVAQVETQPALEAGWTNPPNAARLRAYWWWLNGNVTKASISRDLEEMKAKGFGGAVIVDAGGAEQEGNGRVPHGPAFLTPEWRELFKHTLREANRLGLEMSLNIQSGWNLGGPMVTADDAAKKLVWSELQITGPTNFTASLPSPRARENYYRDLFVVAYRLQRTGTGHATLQNWQQKALYKTLEPSSAPISTPLFQETPMAAGEEDTHSGEVIDLTAKLNSAGQLDWSIPVGTWQILRFGCTIGEHSYVSTSSDGWKGFAIDVFDAGAFQRYWDAVVEPLIADAGPLAGSALKYLHTDSWEVEAVNWTPTLRAEFLKRRGYDLLPYLPTLAGRIVNDRELSDRFLADYRKTLGDLAIDNHYRLFRDNAHRHGLEIHPESGGPHAVPIDAQRCLGWDDVPMSEFWAWSWMHRIGDENRYFVKQPASAAHTYGHVITQDEGFTTIGPHWQETIWDNLKPSFDKAICEGMNRLVWHAFVCSPAEMGVPGQQYFAGTHLNPNVTWWSKAGPFLNYINRCQFMMQQGLFDADVCYYYGDHVPNFSQLKKSDPAKILPGYDYDVITEEALLERMSVRDKRLMLPDGMSYRVLVLPDRAIISLPVLRKLKELVANGATVIGPRPVQASGLQGYPESDAEVAKLAAGIWGNCDGKNVTEFSFGQGRIIWGRTAREVLRADGIQPDFEFSGGGTNTDIDYIHRTAGNTEIYFVANRSKHSENLLCQFRVAGKVPEYWNAVSGEHYFVDGSAEPDGRTKVALTLDPCGSGFVIFRGTNAPANIQAGGNFLKLSPRTELEGPWTVNFDPKWGGPESVEFRQLASWTARPEPGIKYYSGTAIYRKRFDLPPGGAKSDSQLWLDLGEVHELAEVRLNGKNLGVLWTPPFRVNISDAATPLRNELEIEVVNFWPNRIIGDQSLPAAQRFTRTNIRKLTATTALMESGLIGPVRILAQP